MRVTDYLADFVTPDPRFSPAPQWWWSGEPLTIDRLRWQMDRLVAMGIHNVSIIDLAPNGTMFGADADQPPFLSEAWWQVFEQVCDHAATIGMFIWFYDQIGFSGASFQAEIAERDPTCVAHQLRSASVDGAGTLSVRAPEEATPLAAHVTANGATHVVNLDGHAATIEVDAPSKLTIVFTVRQAYDLLSPDACERLLNTVHREFTRRLPQHIGKTIVGSFQDELPDVPTWGATFADTFEQSFGYRLEPVIHRLFEPGDADARRTRVHYHQHRAALAEAAFFKPLFEWHASRDMIGGFDQQSPAREARVLGCTEKYADYMQTMKWYGAPGSDHYGNAKLHSSIAFLHDRPRVWLEGFHSTGWGGTIADTFDWLLPFLQAGANLYDPHAVYYSTRKGWWEWAAPSTCWRQPYAMHYRAFAEQIMRLTKLLSRGVAQAKIGVLFPTTTVQAALGATKAFDGAKRADETLAAVMGSMRWHQSAPGPLDVAGIDYHVLDEAAIAAAGGAMAMRGVRFEAIVLPAVTIVDDATLAALEAFAARGGRIVAVGVDEASTLDGRAVRWSSLPNARFVDSASSLVDAIGDLPRDVVAPVATLHRRDGDAHILFVPAITGMATQVKWPSWFAPIERTTVVPERYLKTAAIRLPASARGVLRFDARDGSSTPVAIHDGCVDLDFEGAAFAVLVWTDDRQYAGAERTRATPAQMSIDARAGAARVRAAPAYSVVECSAGWSIEYLPTLPTEFADVHDPARPEQRLPTTPAFRWARGDIGYSRGIPDDAAQQVARATFGTRAWRVDDDGREIPIVYSPEFGLASDPQLQLTLGPKGHVPEEFIDLGKLTKGQRVVIRAGVVSDAARDVVFAIGANARKSARVNDDAADDESPAYLWSMRATLRPGENAIDFTLAAERDGIVRAFWCLLDPARAGAFARPERIVSTEPAQPGSTLAFRGRFEAASPVAGGSVKVSVAAVARVFVDDIRLGRLGGFDPLRLQLRGQVFDVPPLAAGSHEIRVELVEPNATPPLVVDARIDAIELLSDDSWTVARDGGEERPVGFRPHRDEDRAAWHLYRRPHPLPASRWLDDVPANDVVLDLPLAPPLRDAEVQWFEWTVPPGATSLRLPLVDCGDATLWIDGERHAIDAVFEAGVERRAVLRVTSRQLGGGCWRGPVTYDFGVGTLTLGDWCGQGLASYSGAIRMRQRADVPAGDVTLDLGRVRGTVEAFVDGRSVGVRVMPPYRFDWTDAGGARDVELVVTNTLVNHLHTWSPSTWWSPDQLACGVFGPVTIGAK